MARRPPSSSARPYTADRPSTARPSTSTAYFDHQPQYTYSAEYTVDEDDDDESDAEDVFAFGPPSTADQQPPVLQPSQQELPHDLHPNTLTIAPQASERPPSPASSPVTFPPPTFDLYGVDRFSPVPGPSTLHPRHPYPYPLSPVESPPSTDSQSHDGSPYRMHRLQTAVSMTPTTPISPPGTGMFSGISSAISTKEAHIALPSAKEKFRESVRPKLKGRPSTLGSLSFDDSILEVDTEDDTSVK